ncbi:MAG TPA: ThuA domain-containing protein [Gemmataceae bacterium]|nr:ThuA domain-containing protein [Gemmataceae bacterium]
MNRRQLLQRAGLAALALGASRFPLGWAAPADGAKKKILMYTRSQGFQHSVITRGKDGKLSLAEQIVTDLGAKHNFDVVCEKDGGVFESKDFPSFDGFLFETQGNLSAEKSLEGAPPVTAKGKQNLLDAVADGKGFVACHCGSDTWHSPGPSNATQDRSKVDPYIAMLGGEFIVHGAQQKSNLIVADPKWPGLPTSGADGIMEEWYALKNFAPDLHVILVMDTNGMKGDMYQRPPYPETWARMHEKGRVFFTSLGHREDVWQSDFMQNLLLSGLAWTLGNVEADVTPNIDQATPKANELPMKK